jgi:DNA-binding XRE family transcriptional regulator
MSLNGAGIQGLSPVSPYRFGTRKWRLLNKCQNIVDYALKICSNAKMAAVISTKNPKKVRLELAAWMRQLRVAANWTQEELAERSGVTLATLRRFETTGLISSDRLLGLAHVLGVLDKFADLAKQSTDFTSISQVESLTRKRASRRKPQP